MEKLRNKEKIINSYLTFSFGGDFPCFTVKYSFLRISFVSCMDTKWQWQTKKKLFNEKYQVRKTIGTNR